uniref:Uncharacterized protein n=1 Tax=Tetranychus urticae TaxID=32264 RepID=T1K6J4_TETUR
MVTIIQPLPGPIMQINWRLNFQTDIYTNIEHTTNSQLYSQLHSS